MSDRYEPDMLEYQQLADNDPTGRFDCTAEAACILADATTSGAVKLQPDEVRRASSEPKPDPKSPGLNLEQARDAVLRLTDARIRLDVHDPMPVAQAQARIAAGEWAEVQLVRGVLVDRGVVAGSRVAHAVSAHEEGPSLRMGDPLVPRYVELGWDDLWAAAEAFARPGHARVAFVPGPVQPLPAEAPEHIGPRPDGATGWLSVAGSFFRWHPGPRRTAHRGKFTAWASEERLAYAGRKYPGFEVMSGGYGPHGSTRGWLVFPGSAVHWHPLPKES